MSEGPKIGAGGRKKQIHRAKSARWRTVPHRCARQDDGEREVASGDGRRRKDYGAVRTTTLPQRPLPFFQAGIPSFSRTVHSTLPDERKHIQVVQNKQLVSCSLDTIRKRSRAGFFTRIRRPGGFRGFTECPREIPRRSARSG